MAVLQNMREKFGIAISVIIALSLLYFIAPMDDLMTLFGRPQNVGEIAGKGISYEDFLAEVDKQTNINEIVTGSSVQSEQQQQQIRNAAWQEMLDRNMFLKNAKAAGINVGSAEMVELTTGEQASPFVSQNTVFFNENGVFDPKVVVEFVQNIQNDETGRLKLFWNYVQHSVYNQAFYAKYGSLFTASGYENALQKESDVAQNNTKANVDYVFAPYGYQRDSSIQISSKDIKAYYKDHKKNYKQIANRDIEYVVYEVVPSAADIAATNDQMAKAYLEFQTAENLKTFLLKNSDRQLNDWWYKEGELTSLNKEVNDFVFSKNASGVSPIFQKENSFFAVKVIDSKMVPDSVYVKHILLQGADAKHIADSLLNEVKAGADFADLASRFSVDKQSAADNVIGNLGWLTQNYMFPGLESVITADIKKPYIVNSRYGTHVVLVTEKRSESLKKKVAILEKETLPSKETFNNFYSQANKFASITNGSYEGYRKAVDSTGVYSHSLNINEGTSNYGAIENAKEITRWAFEAKKGKASAILTVNQKYFFVAALKEIHKEGYKTVEEVTPQIEQILYSEALKDSKKAEAAAKIAGMTDLAQIAEALKSSVSAGEEVSFATMGREMVEPAALGAMYKAEINKICGPVAGEAGIYVFKVNSRNTESFYTAEDAESFQAQKTQYASQMIMPVMMEAADVKDNRARYF